MSNESWRGVGRIFHIVRTLLAMWWFSFSLLILECEINECYVSITLLLQSSFTDI